MMTQILTYKVHRIKPQEPYKKTKNKNQNINDKLRKKLFITQIIGKRVTFLVKRYLNK